MMATVPGTPDNLTLGLPKVLHPTDADILMAASIVNDRQRLAGDVIPMPGARTKGERVGDAVTEGTLNKLTTANVLGRALGRQNVLPITPKDR